MLDWAEKKAMKEFFSDKEKKFFLNKNFHQYGQDPLTFLSLRFINPVPGFSLIELFFLRYYFYVKIS